MKKVTIIDYGSGNIHSTAKAFEKIAARTGHKVLVTNKAADLADASHIVLPGVGAFGDCMEGLSSLPGMVEALNNEVHGKKKPFLGICVGMQLMAEKGYEHGVHNGLGWVKGAVKHIETDNPALKIPHMGWNELKTKKSHPFFAGIKNGDHAYFVHSYGVECEDREDILAEAEYGGSITAAIARDNMMGTQFHPEKSQETGMKLIENFLRL